MLTCAGTGLNSGVIAGVVWFTGNHSAGAPAVVNMSLGGGESAASSRPVSTSIADGITYAVAAGNGTRDVFTFSRRPSAVIPFWLDDEYRAPARASATSGRVSILAPGSNMTSALFLPDRHRDGERRVDGGAARRLCGGA